LIGKILTMLRMTSFGRELSQNALNRYCSRLPIRLILAIFLIIALSDCRDSYGDGPVTNVNSIGSEPLTTSADFLAKSKAIDVPRDHRDAASTLVAQALDPETSVAAVREILTRAGIRIINSEGLPLNTPATPSKIGVTVYDFQVPTLAENLRKGSTVRLSRVAELSQELRGVELPDSVLTEVVQSWIKSAPTEPENPEAFDAALLQELANILPIDRADGRIHLLSFLVLSADIYGSKGTYRHSSTTTSLFSNALGLSTAHAATPCPPDTYDPWDGASFKTGKTIVDWIVDIFRNKGSQAQEAWKAGGKANKALDIVDILDSTLARAALVAGLKVEVSNDAAGKELHLRHSSGGSDMHPVKFTATVRFETPWPGATVQCGPLKGYTIPDNSAVSGVWVEWTMTGKYLDLLDDLTSTHNPDADKLQRGGGGGSATDGDGKVELRAETVTEEFCSSKSGEKVDKAKCGRGKLVRGSSGAEAQLDLTKTPPIKFKDLLSGRDPRWAAGKALFKVLTDIVTDIANSASAARSNVRVAWHDSGVYVWAGTITYTYEYETSGQRTMFERGGGNAKNITTKVSESTRLENVVEAILKPVTPSFEGASKPIGRVTHRFERHERYVRNQDFTVTCRAPGQNMRWRTTNANDSSTTDEQGHSTQWLPIYVYLDESTGKYEMSISYPALTTTWTEKNTNEPAGGCENPPPTSKIEEGVTSPISEAYAQSGRYKIQGQIDPNVPDTLSGNKITGDLKTTGRTIEKWNLRRVKPTD
jgi:hypothetical protein